MNTTELIISIISSIISGALFATIKPIKRVIIEKFIRRKIGVSCYFKKNKEKIYDFSGKKDIRVSVSVLARIENNNGKYLLRREVPTDLRQDSMYKPLGGSVKISENINQILIKKDPNIVADKETRYSAKKDDFRLFMKIKNNKVIHKAIYSETEEFYKGQLIKKMSKEMNVNEDKIDELFDFNASKVFCIHPYFTEPIFSHVHKNDYVHHIVFDIKIKDSEALEGVIKQSKNME